MTDDDREQVVELLRCAADLICSGASQSFRALSDAEMNLYDSFAEWKIGNLAADAEHATNGYIDPDYWSNDRMWLLLEAAQRVEEGSHD